MLAGRGWIRYLIGVTTLGVVYWSLAELGYAVQFTGGVQAVWLPVGWAVGFLYLFGWQLWPGALVADIVLGLTSGEAAATQVMQTTGNMLEVLVATGLALRWVDRQHLTTGVEELGRLAAALVAGTLISAPIGVASLVVVGDITGSEVPNVWRTWWLADTSGALVVAPILLLWADALHRKPRWPRMAEAAATIGIVVGLSFVGFNDRHPLSYIVFPALILVALRFGVAGAAAAGGVAAFTAVGLTANHRGPFVVSSIDDTVLSVQLYVLVAVITSLVLGSVVSARRAASLELEAARLREAEQQSRERRRIARDLHDSVSQTLFSLSLQARTVERLLDAAGPGWPAVDEPLHQIGRLAQSALAELHALIFDLRPEGLAEDGLVAALSKRAAALAAQREVSITVTGPPRRAALPLETEAQLYRIGQEAMANAATHARPSHIAVECSVADGNFRLQIADNGVGFDLGHDAPGHLGLRTMRSRAEECGGTLLIDSRLDEGTTVLVVVPLVPAARRGDSPPPTSGPWPVLDLSNASGQEAVR